MKILIVAEPASIHTARWVNQFIDIGWDVHIISGVHTSFGISKELRGGTVHLPNDDHPKGIRFNADTPEKVYEYMANLCFALSFDIVHSLGLCVNLSNRLASVYILRSAFPEIKMIPWIYSSWGMDLDIFAPNNRLDCSVYISDVDYFISEGKRDLDKIYDFGFKGEVLGTIPAFGGITWNIDRGEHERKRILIKGRDIRDGDYIGRAHEVMLALQLLRSELKGYKVTILQSEAIIRALSDNLRQKYGLDTETPKKLETHEEVLELYKDSCLFISNTINDGLPSSLVEAMSLGAVPISSDLPSIREWITNDHNGLLVDPLNPFKIASTIRKALIDKDFLKNARLTNLDLAERHWTRDRVLERALSFYNRVLQKAELRVN